MELRNQVCSLELAKKLKELNCQQDSLWYWIVDEKTKEVDLSNGKPIIKGLKFYSAFTVAELGEMLPIGYCSTNSGKMIKSYVCGKIESNTKDCYAKTEVNSRAMALIYLLEKNLIKLT